MKTYRNSSASLAAAVVMILATPSAAWADEGRDNDQGHGWNKGGSKVNEHNNVHYNNHYAGRYAAKGPYYYPPRYAYFHPCSNCGKQHHHNNHNRDNDKLWIGLLGGGILGYGLGVYQQRNAADEDNYPLATSAPPPPVTPRYPTTAQMNSCLQEREYRTKIMVGGREVEGYGTACLQPDGSWRYGAAQPEGY